MKSAYRQRKQELRELGFGSKTTENIQRALNRDGSFNRQRTGENFLDSFELYHWLISSSWKKFILVVALWYFVTNLIFALLFQWAGPDGIGGIVANNPSDKFWEIFFFSSQTLTTLGYGRLAPVSHLVSAIAAVESMFGLMFFALVTGLLYGRFSRPVAKIIYSSHGVIAPYKKISGFMLRVVNGKSGNLLEPQAEVVLSMKSGETQARIFESLPLERNTINFLPLSWTIVHPIDENSPLYGMTKEEFDQADVEFIVIIKAYDETFAETVYSRTSYVGTEVKWGARFVPMIGIGSSGKRLLMIDKLDLLEEAVLPEVVSA